MSVCDSSNAMSIDVPYAKPAIHKQINIALETSKFPSSVVNITSRDVAALTHFLSCRQTKCGMLHFIKADVEEIAFESVSAHSITRTLR